jgi:DNA-binding response OmpR family regulator
MNGGQIQVSVSAKRSSERIARAAALLRQRGFIVLEPRSNHPAQTIVVGPLVLDMSESTLTCRGRSVRLTPFKFLLLRALVEAEGAWCSRRALRKLLWGEAVPASDSLAVHMHFLREQIAQCTGMDVVESGRVRGFRIDFERLADLDDEPHHAS